MIRGVPYDAEIEYLESTGEQWIDTGIKINYNNPWDIKTKAISKTLSTRSCIASSFRTHGEENVSTWLEFTVENKIRFGYGLNIYSPVSYIDPTNISFSYFNGKVSILVNGTDVSSAFGISRLSDKNNLLLFNDVRTNVFSGTKIYFLKYCSGDTLVRDFIPVRVGDNGYMYDRVTRKLFGNKGTGSFLLGPDVARPVMGLHLYPH